ncbi:cation diffusion facilitator family transporter [Candidatus Ruminimicrobium bovinum]|uniref:cation diffusion facilitator family transporter n=1 Tax=Candidatus Ruminimicrobium bovinum TaxID=3242779 RepID=UPI0039B84371
MDNKKLSVAENSVQETINRDKIIVHTSIVGIITNILLAAFKATIGLISNSIAVILDAVNNLSDVLSSLITIIGAKLANKLPDKKHPLGHGRIEYMSALLVSAIVLYAGITAAIESIKRIIHPQVADYSIISLIIIAVAVIVKIILGKYVKSNGEKVKSTALIASGTDAMFDAILSASVLASAIIYFTTKISLEAYVGIIISVVIIKAGIEMMSDTLGDILGKRADSQTTKKIKQLLTQEPEVRGAYDLIIHNYGPNKNLASVHLELPDIMTVEQVDKLTRKLQTEVYHQTGVILAGVGVYSYNTKNDEAAKVYNTVHETVMAHDWILQIHGFYADTAAKKIRFDVVICFETDANECLKVLYNELKQIYPEYEIAIVPDVDISD